LISTAKKWDIFCHSNHFFENETFSLFSKKWNEISGAYENMRINRFGKEHACFEKDLLLL
jgi:hypothetical protein